MNRTRFSSSPSAARWRASVLSIASALAVFAVAACSGSSTSPGGASTSDCKQGETVACTCADGTTGSQTCGASQCTCGAAEADSGTSANPIGGGDGGHLHDAAPPAVDAQAGAFGASCTTDAQCTDSTYNVCFAGGQRSFCTKRCTASGDCSNPPTTGQCNQKGYCK